MPDADSQPTLTPQALATWTDEDLIDEWRKTSWLTADSKLAALAGEIERRGLEF